jgi:hypothetical protein
MWCLRVHKLLSAFVDGELHSPDRTQIEKHIGRCRWCRRDLRRVRRGAHLAGQARTVDVPSARDAMVVEIVSRGALEEAGLARRNRTTPPWLLPIGATAALLFALAFFDTPLRRSFGPLRGTTAYALDFGLDTPDDHLLDTFRAKYAGKFREFPHQGPPDPSWVPYAIKYPTQLPERMRLRSVMIFDPRYCGSLVLNFSEGDRNLHLVQQPADRPISLSGLKTTQAEVCKYNATHGAIGSYRVMTWTADNIRSVILSNLDSREIETFVASLR